MEGMNGFSVSSVVGRGWKPEGAGPVAAAAAAAVEKRVGVAGAEERGRSW